MIEQLGRLLVTVLSFVQIEGLSANFSPLRSGRTVHTSNRRIQETEYSR